MQTPYDIGKNEAHTYMGHHVVVGGGLWPVMCNITFDILLTSFHLAWPIFLARPPA